MLMRSRNWSNFGVSFAQMRAAVWDIFNIYARTPMKSLAANSAEPPKISADL